MAAKKKSKKLPESLVLIISLMAVSMLSGGVLAAVYAGTQPIIEANQGGELMIVLGEVFSNSDGFEEVDDLSGKTTITKLFTANRGGEDVGYVALAEGNGFGGNMKVAVGFDTQTNTITGMKVMAHTETPGLGTVINEPRFTSMIKDASFNSKIDTFTGATVSQVAVMDIINAAMSEIGIEGRLEKA